MNYLGLLLALVLAACSGARPPAARQPSPYVDAIKDARSVEASTQAATRAREAAVNAVQP